MYSFSRNIITFLFISFICLDKASGNGNISSAEEIVQLLTRAEGTVINAVRSSMKFLLPTILRVAETNISSQCFIAMNHLLRSVTHLKEPALRMIDATSKPLPGILRGATAQMGDYDECLDIRVNHDGEFTEDNNEEYYHGLYCTIEMKVPPAMAEQLVEYKLGRRNISELGKYSGFIERTPAVLFLKFMKAYAGICVPSECSKADLQNVLTYILDEIDIDHGIAVVKRCEDDTFQLLDTADIIVIAVLAVWLSVVLLATFYEAVAYAVNNDYEKIKKKAWEQGLLMFALHHNLNLVFSSNGRSKVACINGLHVLMVYGAVTLFHVYNHEQVSVYSRNVMNYMEMSEQPAFTFIAGYVAMGSIFFTISGFLLTYNKFKNGHLNMTVNPLKMVAEKYLRRIPLAMVIIGFTIILKHMGSGPAWTEIVGQSAEDARKYWWMHFLAVGNLFSSDKWILTHLWYVSCWIQLSCIGILFLWILSKNRAVGIMVIICTAVVIDVTHGIGVYIKEYPPGPLSYFGYERLKFDVWSHSSPVPCLFSFSCGMVLGCYMNHKLLQKWSKVRICAGWMISILAMYSLLHVMYQFHDGKGQGTILAVVYASLNQVILSTNYCWVILAVTEGYGGFFGQILCWKGFEVLNKLTFSMYLMHYLVFIYDVGSSRSPKVFCHQEIIFRISSYIMLTTLAGLAFHVIFEIPLYFIVSRILPRKRTSQTTENNNENKNIPTTPSMKQSKENGTAVKLEPIVNNV